MRSLRVDDGKFEITIEGSGRYGLPDHSRDLGIPAGHILILLKRVARILRASCLSTQARVQWPVPASDWHELARQH